MEEFYREQCFEQKLKEEQEIYTADIRLILHFAYLKTYWTDFLAGILKMNKLVNKVEFSKNITLCYPRLLNILAHTVSAYWKKSFLSKRTYIPELPIHLWIPIIYIYVYCKVNRNSYLTLNCCILKMKFSSRQI